MEFLDQWRREWDKNPPKPQHIDFYTSLNHKILDYQQCFTSMYHTYRSSVQRQKSEYSDQRYQGWENGSVRDIWMP